MINVAQQVDEKNKKTQAPSTKKELAESLSSGIRLPITMKNITPADVDFIYKLVIPHMEEKVKYIAMEMMQNILKYQHPGHKDKSQMSIIPDESSYVMKFSNYIPYDEEKIDTLQSRIDVANMFTLSELKQAYRATLSNGTYTEKGGAGLGFLDIAKKIKSLYSKDNSDNENKELKIFDYSILPTDIDGVYEFTVKIRVPFEKQD